jgi:hypothetical protein
MSFAVLQLASDYVFTPYIMRQGHGTKVANSPTCDLYDADDIQDEQHVLFHCVNPHVISLHRIHASLFPQTGAHNVPTS